MSAIVRLAKRAPMGLVLWTCPLILCLVFLYHHQSGAAGQSGGFWSSYSKPVVESSERSRGQNQLNHLRINSVSHKLVDHDVQTMGEEMARLTVHSYLDQTDGLCSRKLRMGKIGDGGWEICDDLVYRPVPPCIIYSFGINDDFTFDDEAADLYGCHVYAFDPSMKAQTHNRSARVHFFKIGLSGKSLIDDNGWKLFTMEDLRLGLGHAETRIDVVKMDIEGAEWTALPNALATGQLDNVRQLLVEFHTKRWPAEAEVQLLQDIEKAGFRRFYVHKNARCRHKIEGFPIARTSCYEVHYVRVL